MLSRLFKNKYNKYMEKTLSWEKYFIALAKVSGLRSKDPSTKVGAVIVNNSNRVIGIGYNGMPNGDDTLPWAREGELEKTKYPYVIHAEMNAILNSTKNVDGASLYVTLMPCRECAKFIVQAGIKKVVYTDDKYKDTEDYKISEKIFNHFNVKLKKIDDFEIDIK